MKRQNILPIAAISLLLVMIIASAAREVGARRVQVPDPTPTQWPVSVDRIYLAMRNVLEDKAPDQYYIDIDKDEQIIIIDLWFRDVTAATANSALQNSEGLAKWNEKRDYAAQLSQEFQFLLDRGGQYDYSVVVRFVNRFDTMQVLVAAERGEVIYDVVEATPAGETVPEPEWSTDVSATSMESVYVTNTFTKIFHLAGCPFAARISAENRVDFHGDRADLIAQGYLPCTYCDP